MSKRYSFITKALVGGVALCLVAPAFAQLEADEAAMVNWIEDHTGEVEALIERTVNINSGTMHFDDAVLGGVG